MTADQALRFFETAAPPAAGALALWEWSGEDFFRPAAQGFGKSRGRTAFDTEQAAPKKKRLYTAQETQYDEQVKNGLRTGAASSGELTQQPIERQFKSDLPANFAEWTGVPFGTESRRENAAFATDKQETETDRDMPGQAIIQLEQPALPASPSWDEEESPLGPLLKSLMPFEAELPDLSVLLDGTVTEDRQKRNPAKSMDQDGRDFLLNLTYRQALQAASAAPAGQAGPVSREIPLFSGSETEDDATHRSVYQQSALTADDVIEELERRLLWEMQGETEGVYR